MSLGQMRDAIATRTFVMPIYKIRKKCVKKCGKHYLKAFHIFSRIFSTIVDEHNIYLL